jgi:hypothetical protein
MTIKQSRSAIAATALWNPFGDHVAVNGVRLNVQRGTGHSLFRARRERAV